MDAVRQQFAEQLRACRLRRGVTQQQLAELSTVSVRAIRDLEIGRARRPRRETVRLIADGLRLTGRARTSFEEAARADAARAYPPAPGTGLAPPPAMDELIGRAGELSALRDLLGADGPRLVTVVGLPGAGKTRLALELAGATGPAFWVRADELARHADELASADDRDALLVVDGCTTGAPDPVDVVGLLRECRRLRILVTARRPLDIPGECTVPLAPLAVPGVAADTDQRGLACVSSVRLLLRQAGRVRPGFGLTAANAGAVATICRLLDGIPVALETVADWFLVYEPDEVVELVRLDPFAAMDHRAAGAELRVALRRVVDSLDPVETTLLDRLGRGDDGRSGGTAIRPVHRLLQRGAVRQISTGGHARFRELRLVRFLRNHRPDPVVTGRS